MALRFYASGSLYIVMGDTQFASKATICRVVGKVSEAIASLNDRYISFPTNNEAKIIAQHFYTYAGFPGVCGTIDCTHIPILQSPSKNIGERFRNRKGYFSINVQTICDNNLVIRDIVARWPGSVHDATIFDNSHVRLIFETEQIQRGLTLLGDNGYPLRNYLMTPLLRPITRQELRYNRSHKTTRNSIERVYGIWKRRFPCLSMGLRTHTQRTLTIIVATAVLHNIAVQIKDLQPPDDIALKDFLEQQKIHNYQNEDIEYQPNHYIPQNDHSANAFRNSLIQNHFNIL